MNTKVPMTIEEFSHMQTGETEDYELVDGELISWQIQRRETAKFAIHSPI